MCSREVAESQGAGRRVGVSGTIDRTELEQRLWERYQAQGFSQQLYRNDLALLRRVCVRTGDPCQVTISDMEAIVLCANRQGTRANYVARIKSIWSTLRKLDLVHTHVDEQLASVRKPRGIPRPLSQQQAEILMTQTNLPYRHWFILGCLAGLRAMEVSGLRGDDLEESADGFVLRVRGKGGTDLTIPAHPAVVEMIQSYRTLGRLWNLNPNKLSSYACAEMRRVGVEMKFHSCRHYFATSALKASGGDLLVVRDLLRHASVATSQVYAQLEKGRSRSVVDLLSIPVAV